MKKESSFMKEWEDFKKISKYRVKCKCSHTVILISRDRAICTHCGNWIYKTPQIEFRYKLQEQLKKEKEDEREFNFTEQAINKFCY